MVQLHDLACVKPWVDVGRPFVFVLLSLVIKETALA